MLATEIVELSFKKTRARYLEKKQHVPGECIQNRRVLNAQTALTNERINYRNILQRCPSSPSISSFINPPSLGLRRPEVPITSANKISSARGAS